MEWATLGVIAGAVVGGILIGTYAVTRAVLNSLREAYVGEQKTAEGMDQKGKPEERTETREKTQGVNEEELVKRLREVIEVKVQRVLDEAKTKKERLLLLLDVARGYALGYVSEDEYNAFLSKVLSELEEFKRLWLARFPSQRDRDKLNQMIGYVAKTKLPIVAKGKDGKTITLPPEEALIKITNSINGAVALLDEMIASRGDNPAITPLEVRLQQECERLREKVKRLEKQLEECQSLS
ncbi:hypothetical protein [Thermococcus sp.]|uniref:hypothetical protein n=1 Tax=Thermococcus sp. TaxID=35749 RepID=UPI00260E46F1|nr:hypothetical protein [Thermococcus sp.]